MENAIKKEWNKNSDEYFQNLINQENYDKIIQNPECAFPVAIFPLLKKYIGEFHDKKVLVPSSGDNIGAFGLHLLGAKVTSCDLAENQLKNAKMIADKHNWEIEFICQDSMKLENIKDGEYDLVYTSNGTHVWISDMPCMYSNFYRVLKRGGFNIFFETHPMIRPFDDSTYEVKIKRHYTDIYAYASDEVPKYLWRTQDFINAACSAGFIIKEMQEFHSLRGELEAHNYLCISDEDKNKSKWIDDTFDWKNNPWAALPQCLCLCSQKI
jgi:ubiquinone/menaquinone biosynthesis C-methylase UbiE